MKLSSSSPEETEDLGFRFGELLKAGDVVGLYGDLGAGKTTFVRGIARALGISPRDVTSASFTIIAEYPGNPPLSHVDLYRLEDPAAVDDTGIWDCIGGASVCVIEWAERLRGLSNGGLIRVAILDRGEQEREIIIEGLREEDWRNL